VIDQLCEELGADVARDVLRTFLGDATAIVESMDRALSSGRARELGRGAHTLKSTARSVGALRLGDMCAAVEKMPPSTAEPLQHIAAELGFVHAAIETELVRLSTL
jgi:HPt (histidine-containing phosphotransfer) domain-containing protein